MRSRLIALIGIPLLLLQGLVVGLEYAVGRASELAELEQDLAQRTQLAALDADSVLSVIAEVARNTAGLLADNPQFDDYQRHRILRSNVETHPAIVGAAATFEPWITRRLPLLYRPQGRQRVESVDLNRPNQDPRHLAWYQRARTEAELFWLGPYADPETATDIISSIVPMRRNGGFAGAVTVSLRADTLQAGLARHLGKSARIALVDRTGSILITAGAPAYPASLKELAQVEQRSGYAEIGRPIAAREAGLTRLEGHGPDHPPRLVAYAPVAANGWSVLAEIDGTAAYAEINERLLRQSLLYGLGTAGMLGLIWWWAGATTRPLRLLADTAQDVAAGNLEARVPGPLPNNEIGDFSRGFNRMVGALKDTVDARLAEATARQAVESELEIAREIQCTLLPPPYTGTLAIDIAGGFVPAHDVAGDFYDWFPVDAETVGLVIADVSGKGVPALLFMAVARASLRTSGAGSHGPAETLNALNAALFENNPLTMFVTVFCAHYHTPSGRLSYANAGHNLPYILRTSGDVEALGDSTGRLLAVFPDAEITEAEARLQPGETLVLYTDGVTEACDPEGRFFDDKRLELVLKNTAGESARIVCDRIAYAVGDHCKGPPQDDLAILVVHRKV